MYWYVGPWQWKTVDRIQCWTPPDNCLSALDLRSIPQQSATGKQEGFGIFLCSEKLPSEYELLGAGDWKDVKTSQRLRDRIPRRGRRQSKGDDLLGHILDAVCDGSDPTGETFAKPLMPTTDGKLELHLGQSHSERFEWGDARTQKIKDVLRADIASQYEEVRSGRAKRGHHQKCIDYLCEKYKVHDWREFVPSSIQKDIPGRLKHETTITDNFNRANGAIGSSAEGWAWSAASVSGSGGISIVSNAAQGGASAAAWGYYRAQSDLSGSDMSSEVSVTSFPSSTSAVISCRYATAAFTSYSFFAIGAGATTYRVYKIVAGAFTILTSSSATRPTAIFSHKITANGSTITGLTNGGSILSVSDTSITGNTRAGLGADAATNIILDDFTASDLTASGVIYTQLERGLRGVTRGVYTRNGG